MKYLEKFSLWKKKEIEKDNQIGNDDQKVTDIFNTIQSGFDNNKLSKYGGGDYGYYFRYKVDSELTLEVGLHSLNLSENNSNFKRADVSKSIIDKVRNYFESKSGKSLTVDYYPGM